MSGVANLIANSVPIGKDVIGIRRKTDEQFMMEMSRDHPTLTVLGKYRNNRTKIELRCNVCGKEFSAVPASLYCKHGCPRCGGTGKRTHEEFVQKMHELYPTITVLGKYKNTDSKVLLRCDICDYEWESLPHSFLCNRGCGCPQCSGVKRKTHAEFVKEIAEMHPDLKILGKYKNSIEKIDIQCKRCGNTFNCAPHYLITHPDNSCCPYCCSSSGEKRISDWLDRNGFCYTKEYRFNDCRDKQPLPFDFYCHQNNLIIEYDGKQHYEANDFFGGESALKLNQIHDRIKNEYCKAHGIRMIRIPYWDYDHIDELLSKELAS